MTEIKRNQKQAGFEVEIFPVSFVLGKINEDIIINTNTLPELSKEKIINQALNFHSQGNISEAVKYYKYFIKQGFKDPIVFSNYGVILTNLGKLKEAELLTRKAIKLNPDYANAHFNLGNILKDLCNIKEAELSYRQAIKLKPDYADAHLNLGGILSDLYKLEEAELSTRKAIKIKPDYAGAHDNLGSILKYLKKCKEAEISYSRAIELQPNFTNALINRAQLFFEQGEFDKALRDLDSCNTEKSRALGIETLYALGRIEEIYERIDRTSKLDNENIRLAAFSSFIAEQEKKDTSNNFCRKPLSFLYFSNLKFHIKDYEYFIKGIINELANIKTTWEPPNQTTYGGFQTPSHINLFFNSPEKISYLKSIILNELDSYFLKFKKENCSYIKKWPSKKNLKAWHVILKKQGYQEAHIHSAGWLSGVIYLKVVPSRGKDEGAIEFGLNGSTYSNINSPKLIHHPKAGDIVFFPSSLYHRTIPFSTDTDRIVIAFDLRPN